MVSASTVSTSAKLSESAGRLAVMVSPSIRNFRDSDIRSWCNDQIFQIGIANVDRRSTGHRYSIAMNIGEDA
jgi:hypothetical protein